MPPRFYLLHGQDEFASAEFVGMLKEKMGDPYVAALNITVLDGRSVTLGEVRSVCDTLPFLTERRLVVVDGWLSRLAGKGESGESAAEMSASARETLAALVEYLPHLPATTALVCVEKRTLPAWHPVLKAAAQSDWALVKLFEVPRGEALVKWIMARAKAAGGEITRAAAQALADAESEPRALDNEIAKLLAYVNYARPVEAADVAQLTPAAETAGVFALVDAIGQRRGPPAMRELRRLLEKEEPLYVLGMIVRQFRLILQARELLAARHGEAEVARQLGLHPYPAGKICAQARNFAPEDLERVYHRLLDYDVAIKTGRMDAGTALEVLVATLTAA